jgi:hypothetical protein
MKRAALVSARVLAVIGVGVALGYFIGRNDLLGQDRAENTVELMPADAESQGKDWKYPGCSDHDSSLGGGGHVGRAKVPPHYCLVMTTQDDYEKVLKFYADKTGISSLVAGTGGGTTMKFDTTTSHFETWFVLNDNLSPGGANQGRPVRAKVFAKRTATYDLTVFISRATNEKHTHIVLAYYPRRQG